MSQELIIIGDLAGNFDPFERLLKEAPKAKPLLVGDIIDRGPKSKELIEWCMSNDCIVLRGNHEDMAIDFLEGCKRYHKDDWFNNGGMRTVRGYQVKEGESHFPEEHLMWLKNLPLYYWDEGLLVTHAPLHPSAKISQDLRTIECDEEKLLWHRGSPRRKNFFQVFGHNSMWGLTWFFGDSEFHPLTKKSITAPHDAWGICLDDSREQKLTAMHWPTLEVFQVHC